MDSSLVALVMIQLLVEPHPVNLFLVYTALFNSPACLEFLLHPYKDYHPDHLLAMIQDKSTCDMMAMVLVTTRYGLLHYDYLIRRTGPFIFFFNLLNLATPL